MTCARLTASHGKHHYCQASSSLAAPPARRQHRRQTGSVPAALASTEGGAALNTANSSGGNNAAATASVEVLFVAEGITVQAAPGDNLYEVAVAAGIDLTVGCCTGSCGICEVEVRKLQAGEARADAAPAVVRTCIAGVPPGYARLEIDMLDDQIWGVDGFDT